MTIIGIEMFTMNTPECIVLPQYFWFTYWQHEPYLWEIATCFQGHWAVNTLGKTDIWFLWLLDIAACEFYSHFQDNFDKVNTDKKYQASIIFTFHGLRLLIDFPVELMNRTLNLLKFHF